MQQLLFVPTLASSQPSYKTLANHIIFVCHWFHDMFWYSINHWGFYNECVSTHELSSFMAKLNDQVLAKLDVG